MSLYTANALSELKWARNATYTAREATRSAKRNTEELEARLQKLKQEYDDCKAAVAAARATEEDAYTEYAQTISKNFASAFLHALPRELRDHVYTFLWDDEDIIRQTKRSIREYAWSYRMPEFCAPPYVRPEHVGQVVAEELALSIYKKAFGTKLHVRVSAGHIHKFLASNPLRSNLKPADCIRSLDIEWYPNEYSYQDVARSCLALSKYEFPEPIHIKLILGRFLSAHQDFHNCAEISAEPVEQLSVFKPAYHALIERDCTVTIESLSGGSAEIDFFTTS